MALPALGGLLAAMGGQIQSGVAKKGGDSGGGLLKFAGGIGKATSALGSLVSIADDLSRGQLEQVRKLGQFNAKIGMANAQLDADRFRRQLQMGQATEGSASRLAQQKSATEEAFAPLEQGWEDFKNDWATKWEGTKEAFANGAKFLALSFGADIEKLRNDTKAQSPFTVGLQALAAGEFEKKRKARLDGLRGKLRKPL